MIKKILKIIFLILMLIALCYVATHFKYSNTSIISPNEGVHYEDSSKIITVEKKSDNEYTIRSYTKENEWIKHDEITCSKNLIDYHIDILLNKLE